MDAEEEQAEPRLVWVSDSVAIEVPESLQERTGCTCPECGSWRFCPATRGL